MRTKFDANEIVIKENHAEIILYNSFNEEKGRAIIDLDNVCLCKKAKWYLRPDGYVATNDYDGLGYTYLHLLILNKNSNKFYGDHKDGNKLNNLRENLREATYSQNGMNKKIRSNNTSGRVGVHFDKKKEKWCSMICFNKKHINLGYYDSFEEAVKIREEAELKYFKEFRPSEDRLKNIKIKEI